MNDVQLTDNHSPNTAQVDLFDSLGDWSVSPTLAFSSWLTRQPVADSTRRVRISMWGKFLRNLDKFGLSLAEVEGHHVASFLHREGLEKEQGWRYVKLIERVYDHLIALGMPVPNPGRIAGVQEVHTRRNDPMRFLNREEKQKLENYIRSMLQQVGDAIAAGVEIVKIDEKTQEAKYDELWAVCRDATVAAVLVGAGVKTNEVVRLSVNCTSVSGLLIVPRSGFNMERRIPLLDLAVDALAIWKTCRGADKNLGRVMFPALTKLRRDDQHTLTSSMHPATVYRRMRALLNAAGIVDARACGQTLRNTFAGELINMGADDQMLFDVMGFKGDFSVLHLRAEYERFLNGLRQ